MQLEQKHHFSLAFITGASSGIGESLCHLLAQKKINLLITGRDPERLMRVANHLQDKVHVMVLPCDLNDREKRKQLIVEVQKHAPDLIINSAGFGLYGEALSHSTNIQLDMIEVNCSALLELTLECARTLIANKKKGVILNISSVAAFYVFPSFAVYSATKAFVNRFSESLNEELQPYGIDVLASCPGMVETQFRHRAGGLTSSSNAEITVMSSQDAAEEIWKQIAKRKPIHLFNWKYRLATSLRFLIPKKWLSSILKARIEKRISSNL